MFKIETKRLIIRDMTPNDEDAFCCYVSGC